MSRWVDYNPHSGLTEVNDYDEETGILAVTKQQDVQDLVDATKAIANSGATDVGIKKGLWHYCSIPLGVQYELLTKYGINIHDRNHWPRMFSVINADYPYLKTTHKKHEMRAAGKIYAATSLEHRNSANAETLTLPGNLSTST
jgi:hypothetical protein